MVREVSLMIMLILFLKLVQINHFIMVVILVAISQERDLIPQENIYSHNGMIIKVHLVI